MRSPYKILGIILSLYVASPEISYTMGNDKDSRVWRGYKPPKPQIQWKKQLQRKISTPPIPREYVKTKSGRVYFKAAPIKNEVMYSFQETYKKDGGIFFERKLRKDNPKRDMQNKKRTHEYLNSESDSDSNLEKPSSKKRKLQKSDETSYKKQGSKKKILDRKTIKKMIS